MRRRPGAAAASRLAEPGEADASSSRREQDRSCGNARGWAASVREAGDARRMIRRLRRDDAVPGAAARSGRTTSVPTRRCRRPTRKRGNRGSRGRLAAGRPAMRSTAAPGGRSITTRCSTGSSARSTSRTRTSKAAEAAFREAEAIVAEAARADSSRRSTVDAAADALASAAAYHRSHRAAACGSISNQFTPRRRAASWTPDLWGRVRRTVESDVATAQASAGDLASARLSAQGTLATDYLQLRVADELKRLLEASVMAYTAGAAHHPEPVHAAAPPTNRRSPRPQAQLEGTRAQLVAVGVTRAPARARDRGADRQAAGRVRRSRRSRRCIAVPLIPAELPSALLERRPDIAAAERDMAAANAQIGVADRRVLSRRHAVGRLRGRGGDAAARCSRASSRIWSFGSTARRDDLRRRRCATPRSSRRAPPTTRASPPTARPC